MPQSSISHAPTAPATRRDSSSQPLKIAGALTLLVALTLLIIAIGVLAQWHGLFSAGVSVMMALYALLVGAIGVAAVRGRPWSTGAVSAAAVLHIMVVFALDKAGHAWLWALLVPLVVTLALAIVARVRFNRDEAEAPVEA